MHYMHQESSTLTCICAPKDQISVLRTNDELLSIILYSILNWLAYHVLQFCHPPKLGLVGHPSKRIEAAQNKLLTCLFTSAYVAASSAVPPSTVSSTVSIFPPHDTFRFSLPHLASLAVPLTDRSEEKPTLLY